MSMDLYKRIAHQLFPTAYEVFFCSGGEPLFYPHIREALMLAGRYRVITRMLSNGMLLNRETAHWLAQDQTLHYLGISFDGTTKETFEKIRVGANFESILHNIEYLANLKRHNRLEFPRLWFRYVLMKSNLEELPDIFSWCNRLGIYLVQVAYLNVSNDINVSESVFHYPDQVSKVFRKVRQLAAEYKVRVELPPLITASQSGGKCIFPWKFCQIDTDGSIKFCYNAWRQRFGFFADDFDRIWKGEYYQKLRRTLDSDKPFFPYCRFCSVRQGYNQETLHYQKELTSLCVIPGLEKLQVSFTRRTKENKSALKEKRHA